MNGGLPSLSEESLQWVKEALEEVKYLEVQKWREIHDRVH